MNSVQIITDPGSCFLGKLEYAKELIKISVDCGADAIKFQLFKNKPPNIELPYEWFPELVSYGYDLGIEVFASAFDTEAVVLITQNCSSIKFAYSVNPDKYWSASLCDHFKKIYISGDIMTDFPVGDNVIKLMCIPEYPVKYTVNFEGIFPRFEGWSSHCLGVYQDFKAVLAGATVVEKHIRLESDECLQVPDGRFALRPKELSDLVEGIRSVSNYSS